MISTLALLDFCQEPLFLKILLFIQKILNIVFIIVPIGLIIMLSLDFSKNVINAEETVSKTNKTIVQRLIMTLFLFAVPTIIKIFIALIDDVFGKSLDYNSCLDNMNNISYYENIKEAQKKQKLSEREREREQNEANALSNQKLQQLSLTKVPGNNSSGGTTSNPSYTPSGAVIVGKKYNLTDDELTQIAALCQQEQSSPEGSAAEASLMANRYELISGHNDGDGHNLYNYIYGNKWWLNSADYMDKKVVKPENKAAVKEVLVLGNRTLPLYIDEHDCFSDIKEIVTNENHYTDQSSISNHNNYVSNETKIYNTHSSAYTFYTFPSERSDPFGYTKHAVDKYNNYNTNNNRLTE